MTSWSNWEKSCRWRLSGFNELNGRHEETRTPDLYRVNFEVRNPQPFPYLAFPQLLDPKRAPNLLGFDGELMASFRRPSWLARRMDSVSPHVRGSTKDWEGIFISKAYRT
jgi:hypothetical protein